MEEEDYTLRPFETPLHDVDLVEYIFVPLKETTPPMAFRCYMGRGFSSERKVNTLLEQCSRATRLSIENLALLNLINGVPCDISKPDKNSKFCIYELEKLKKNKGKQKICVVNVLSKINKAIRIPYVFRCDETIQDLKINLKQIKIPNDGEHGYWMNV